LVDLDLRRPVIGRLFGIAASAGVTDVITGTAPLGEALQDVTVDATTSDHRSEGRLLVLTAGHKVVEDVTGALSSPRLGTVIRSLEDIADVVLIDSPPVMPVSDTLIIASMASFAIAVVQVGLVRRTTLIEMKTVLDSSNTKLIGFVLTGADASDAYGSYQYTHTSGPASPVAANR